MPTTVKVIGSSGQISFGKRHAGRTVTVEEIEDGVWVVRTARVIPDNEIWLHEPAVAETLDRAIEWAGKNPPQPSDLDQVAKRLTRRR